MDSGYEEKPQGRGGRQALDARLAIGDWRHNLAQASPIFIIPLCFAPPSELKDWQNINVEIDGSDFHVIRFTGAASPMPPTSSNVDVSARLRCSVPLSTFSSDFLYAEST